MIRIFKGVTKNKEALVVCSDCSVHVVRLCNGLAVNRSKPCCIASGETDKQVLSAGVDHQEKFCKNVVEDKG